MPLIALLTDFGLDNWYVGEMKAAILGIAPETTIVDICHSIPRGDIRAGAFSLLACYTTFPSGTVFCAVVDPGVGSGRLAIAAKTDKFIFVGPDNGILSWAFSKEQKVDIHEIKNENLLRRPVSATFHGRDVFGPAAAALSHGCAIEFTGNKISSWVQLEWPEPRIKGAGVTGSIIHFDHFGNAITTIDSRLLSSRSTPVPTVALVRQNISMQLRSHFQEVPSGAPVAFLGSAGFLEIAINNGNAREEMLLQAGDPVRVG